MDFYYLCNSYKECYFYYVGNYYVFEKICNNDQHIHAVIYVNADEIIKSGDGSKSSPYAI